ncbi:MAG: type I restriction endonuclease, partial [Verrucomicrobia bacterium]|nr:type I restriction endonuclease [Verrucomicrobiota bacterium]
MSKTDTSEKGLESLIVAAMAGEPVQASAADTIKSPTALYGGTGWLLGDWHDYDRDYAVDLVQLAIFLRVTQRDAAAALDLGEDTPPRRKFLARLQGEISKRGVIDVLRNGVKHGPHQLDLFYGTPTPGNAVAAERYTHNRFTVTRQLRYSRDQNALALDLCLFVNGLPIATFELKNSLTKQTVADAVEQYQRDREPRERLFEFGRCIVHFAVDDHGVRFCTHLKGKGSWFLPFNQGWHDGAGNPPNPDGLKTDYLWKRVLTPTGLTNIWPRFHQLDVVRKLLAAAVMHGAGRRYLIQHSAGSGKSNSIAWLAHQLIGLERDGARVFDSIIVVTDRRILDKQIRDTIKQYAQVKATIGAVKEGEGKSKTQQLREYLESGKKIIISTVQTFPSVLDELGTSHRGSKFAIIIDEAHSSQGGRTSAAISMALGAAGVEEDDETTEDKINRIMESKKLLPNASYFAFTATPKNKTLEIFGEAYTEGGQVKRRPFHPYTMKQAIQEGFILDVLAHYTPVHSYYRLVKTVAGDP